MAEAEEVTAAMMQFAHEESGVAAGHKAKVDEAEIEANRTRSEAVEEANSILRSANERATAMTEEAMAAAARIRSSAQSKLDPIAQAGLGDHAEPVAAGPERVEEVVDSVEHETGRTFADDDEPVALP